MKTAQHFEDGVKSQEERPRAKAPRGIGGLKSALSPAVRVERQQTEPEEEKGASPAGVRPAGGIRVGPASLISLRNSDAEDDDGQLIRLDARRTLSQDSSALSDDWPADFDGLPAEQKERLSQVFSPLGREQYQK